MKKIITLGLALGAGLFTGSALFADDIQFTTLPQPVQTTVIRETHIANPTYVTRVVRADDGIYAVTVRGTSGEQVVYVNGEGAIVQRPVAPAEGTVITYDQVQQDLPRYQLLEKKGRKEVYFDRQTGQKVKVEREKD